MAYDEYKIEEVVFPAAPIVVEGWTACARLEDPRLKGDGSAVRLSPAKVLKLSPRSRRSLGPRR